MKLQNDKKLLKHLHANSPIRDDQDGIRIMTAVDQYLEEHGFHIYPTKKEKGTVSFKAAEEDPIPWKIINIEKGAESFGEYRGRLLYAHLVDANERLICSATLDYILNNFQTRKGIVSNYQEAYDTLLSFSKEIQKYWESNDRKPSADGEEMLLSGKTIISIEHYERRG